MQAALNLDHDEEIINYWTPRNPISSFGEDHKLSEQELACWDNLDPLVDRHQLINDVRGGGMLPPMDLLGGVGVGCCDLMVGESFLGSISGSSDHRRDMASGMVFQEQFQQQQFQFIGESSTAGSKELLGLFDQRLVVDFEQATANEADVSEMQILDDIVVNEKQQSGGSGHVRSTGAGKRLNSKNLLAERRRRKKLNDRLHELRSLVPKITKMDRASILGDAIDYVKELEKQVKDLQDELDEAAGNTTEEDGATKQKGGGGGGRSCDVGSMTFNPSKRTAKNTENHDLHNHPGSSNKMEKAAISTSLDQLPAHCNVDKGQRLMEPQVEVRQLQGNKFFLKVLCEYKCGGLRRLMEVVNSLGLLVTNINVNTYLNLVLSVFTVEKKDDRGVEAEELKDSLLELTRHPITERSADGGGATACERHPCRPSSASQEQHEDLYS